MRRRCAASTPLTPEGNGYYSGVRSTGSSPARSTASGSTAATLFPDPASRFQPDGPHGPSGSSIRRLSRGPTARGAACRSSGQVIYELHVGTFTEAGTLRGAIERLPELADLGITLIELMPVADFAGRFGWGYDGVEPVRADAALRHARRLPRASSTRAHALGLGVILDVVYNHLGPDGNYLARVRAAATSPSARRPSGATRINFDGAELGAGARVLRRQRRATGSTSSTSTACGSTRRSRSSTRRRRTSSPTIGDAVRAARAGDGHDRRRRERAAGRAARRGRASSGGYGLDALWNDDFHHARMVALTGRDEAYYSDYRGVAAGVRLGGEVRLPLSGAVVSRGRSKRRGTPALDLPPTRFVAFSRTTIRSRTPRAGARLHQRDESRAAIAR